MKLEQLAGQRIGLLGFGREGRAFQRVLEARLPGHPLTIFAEQAPENPPPGLDIRVGLAGPALASCQVLVRSPGFPVDHPALEAARGAGVRVVSPSSIWFAEHPDVPVVAITGSKGKSTTAALLAHLARAAGRRVVLAGNIGSPLLDHLETDAELVVAELSSYQLVDLEARPALAIITRLFPEHQDWHGSIEAYYRAKLEILALMGEGPVIINGADELLERRTREAKGRVLANTPDGLHGRIGGLYQGSRALLRAEDLALTGLHNMGNAAVVLEAGQRLGLSMASMLAALPDFQPLNHRLQSLGRFGGLDWVNDSIATTPLATLAALESLAGRAITLLAGGMERQADWREVFGWCRSGVLHALITMPDNGPRLAEEASRLLDLPGGIHAVADLPEAVRQARAVSAPGGVVLLSPGAPSYPRFRDFEDRGNRFADLARSVSSGD